MKRPRYRAGKLGGRMIAGAGWISLLTGLVGAGAAAWYRQEPQAFVAAGVAVISGFFMVVFGQVIQAVITNANQTSEMLRMLEAGPLHWATRPPPEPPPPRQPDRTEKQTDWLKAPSSPVSQEMQSTVGSENVAPCINPFCGRLLPEKTEVCPHCRTRQKRAFD